MKKPDVDDFERLVRENQRVVYQIAFGLVGNASDAEDVAQDAFVLALTKATDLRRPELFRSWVCRIARNVALNRIRADGRARRREELASGDAVHGADVDDVAASAEDREFEARVRAEIDRLPPKLRDTLLLCAVRELEPAAVADLLGIPPGTVRSRLHLARKQLLRALSS